MSEIIEIRSGDLGLETVCRLLGAPSADAEGLAAALVADPAGALWLASAVFTRRLPTPDEVRSRILRVELGEARAVVDELLGGSARGPVDVVVAGVVVDAHHTIHSDLMTGIQRVARGLLEAWSDRDLHLVSWTLAETAPRREDRAAFRVGERPGRHDVVTVPWRSRYLVVELATEGMRLDRLHALAEFSNNQVGVIGFDTVPVTSAETTLGGMRAVFARQLASVATFDAVVAISEAATEEYRGWREMLVGAGLRGPVVSAATLPTVGVPADPAVDVRGALGLDDRLIVLAVGSHEPRKNHEAILFAAERLWREGESFQLVFCGGNAWADDRFRARLAELQAAGRPIVSRSGIGEDVLSGLYREAAFTVFPSFNEGFGLPVAESLAAGTPVVTSGFGSMREIARRGGAEFIDPRDDESLTAGMRRLLDTEYRERLATAAASTPLGSWADYADDVWSAFEAAFEGGGDREVKER
jgi:glycosyltransferase involved in cell wall biosynthesis